MRGPALPRSRHDHLERDLDPPVAGEIPEVCRTREVLAHNNVHIKQQQDLPYESEQWNDVYQPAEAFRPVFGGDGGVENPWR